MLFAWMGSKRFSQSNHQVLLAKNSKCKKMLKPLLLCCLATFSNAHYVGEETVLIRADKITFPPAHAYATFMPFVPINSPCMRGVFSFRDLVLHGRDTVNMDGKYDPVRQVYHMDVINPKFDLIGNYTAQLHFFKNNTYINGEGRLHFASKGYDVRDIQFPVQYDRNARKFQMLYPTSFDPLATDLSGEMTGLKNAVSGASVSMMEMFALCAGLEKPGIVEIWRAVGNYNMEVGFAKRLGDAVLHAFFSS